MGRGDRVSLLLLPHFYEQLTEERGIETMSRFQDRVLCVLIFSMLAIVGDLAAATANLGRIDFPTSGSPAAQELFERGVLLLHSFEYEDARQAFQEAQKIDADFAMSYWGEAMTHNHPLWRQRSNQSAIASRTTGRYPTRIHLSEVEFGND